MQTQDHWLNIFKLRKSFYSDYRLARHWQSEPTRISQYRRERLKLPLAFVLEMAQTLNVNPLEIIVSIEYKKAREQDKEYLKDVWFKAAAQTIGDRMASYSTVSYKGKFRGR